MARVTTDEQLQQIATELVGTCANDIDDICQENGYPPFDNWSAEDCLLFDELAFRCSQCYWWIAGDEHGSEKAEEEAGDFVCVECGEEDTRKITGVL